MTTVRSFTIAINQQGDLVPVPLLSTIRESQVAGITGLELIHEHPIQAAEKRNNTALLVGDIFGPDDEAWLNSRHVALRDGFVTASRVSDLWEAILEALRRIKK